MKISEKFDKNKQNKVNDVEIKNNFENSNNFGEKQFEYDNNNNVEKIDDEVKENNNIDSSENNNKKIHDADEKLDGGVTSAEEKLHNNINNQSSNPYDLPDDF